MNTAISSKRNFVSERPTGVTHTGYAVVALIGGLLLMILGVKMNVSFIAAIGFLPFVTALLYLNANFWAEMFDKGKMGTPRFDRDYPLFD